MYPQTTIPTSGTGYISTYTRAVTGANGTIINGVTISGGYNALTYTATTSGNHYIEFNKNGELNYFDVTVTDASNNIITNPTDPNLSAGRLWSEQWGFTTTSYTQFPVNLDFFVFTGDEFINKVNFQMKPYVFSFVANSYGLSNANTFIVNQQSVTGNGLSAAAEYKIFFK